ncbi:surface-anchored protein [Corynebacterium kutscheri]|uniref:choice-of-anchor M domain-containing protein n=1 Tax=Corynebacterium kutscheri TaxID=35755 RepID=UPI000F6E8E3D|nr:choice-of-anchor M domain-containing protein [Corynebacterium kutscheri]VEH81987.1 surface-anchored protein [Corynebacterium kutscheri]
MFFKKSSLIAVPLTLTLVFGTTPTHTPYPLSPIGYAHAQSVTLDHGHVDAFAVSANGQSILLALKEDVTGNHVTRAPEDVILKVNQSAYTEATNNVAGIGRPTYYLPQTQDPQLLWPGWDTTHVREGGFEVVDIQFLDIQGPGNIFAFSQSAFGGASAVANSGLALQSGSIIRQNSPSHVHVNWAFDAPGTYRMKVHATAYTPNGGSAQSNEATYTWVVGDGSASSQPHNPAPHNPGNQLPHTGGSTSSAPAELANTGASTWGIFAAGIIGSLLGLGFLASRFFKPHF